MPVNFSIKMVFLTGAGVLRGIFVEKLREESEFLARMGIAIKSEEGSTDSTENKRKQKRLKKPTEES